MIDNQFKVYIPVYIFFNYFVLLKTKLEFFEKLNLNIYITRLLFLLLLSKNNIIF